jgi:16S rRNA (guanine(1405)-N(7))-methyltransferase
MNESLEQSICDKVMASKAGREVSPDVVRIAVRWALVRHSPKEAEKAARARLHQLYGSYVGEGWLKEARHVLTCLEQGKLIGQDAATRLFALHGSTRERLAHVFECYDKIFSICGSPSSVLDIACGLNPLSFYLVGKAMCELPAGHFDLALVMKFLPLAERMERGGALKLINAIHADSIVVSFPTRSLSGRNVGMEKNYSQWFEGLGFAGEIRERFICGTEVLYIIDKRFC